MATTISIPEDLADDLYDRKGRGESYADVIRRLIAQADAASDAASEGETPAPDAGMVEHTRTATPASTPPQADESHADTAPETFEDLADAVASDHLPGSGAKLEERRAAFDAVIEYLQGHGTATPAEFRADVYPDHPARYTEGKDPARSWWKNAMYPTLAALAERTEKIERADHTGEWRWVGGDGEV